MGRPGPALDGLLRSRTKPAGPLTSASGLRDQMDIGRSGFQSRRLLQNSWLIFDVVVHGGGNSLCAFNVGFSAWTSTTPLTNWGFGGASRDDPFLDRLVLVWGG